MKRRSPVNEESLNKHLKQVFPFSAELTENEVRFAEDGRGWVLVARDTRFRVHLSPNYEAAWSVLAAPSREDYQPVLVFDRLSAEQAEELRRAGTAFMDRRGNVFLCLPGLYLFVAGRNQRVAAWDPRPSGKLFQVAGVKLVHALLTDPALDREPGKSLLNATVRVIAPTANVSMGSVSELLQEMKERGYLVEDGRNRLLVNRRELFEKWVHGYCEYRPRRHVVHLVAATPDWWQAVSLADRPTRWGGEAAASLLTEGFLRPGAVTLYSNADEPMHDFVLEHGLRQVEDGGNVELLAPMPGRAWPDRPDCVHPLLVYADLIYSGDGRNREAAERIYATFLRDTVEST